MASGFATCSGCGRHVRSSDSACPFCRAVIASPVRAIADLPGVRASRAALFAGAVLVAGCGSDSTPTTGGGSGGGDGTSDGGVAQPVYGAPVTGIDSGVPDSGGTGVAQPAYGAPITEDGGHVAQPVYGAPVYGGSPEPVDAGDAGPTGG